MKLIPVFSEERQSKLNDISLLLLRITFGFTMIYGHGLGKLQKLLAGGEIEFMNFLGLGAEISLFLTVFAEFLCGILLMLGLFTRAVAFPLLFTMLVAIFMVHFNDPFSKLEKPIMYAIPYIVLMLSGGGKYSLDFRLWNKS
ncbi:MAG: DoxX family protein [Saprospiraceae bacterium]